MRLVFCAELFVVYRTASEKIIKTAGTQSINRHTVSSGQNAVKKILNFCMFEKTKIESPLIYHFFFVILKKKREKFGIT